MPNDTRRQRPMDGEREEMGDRQRPFAKKRPLEPGHRDCFSQTALRYPYPDKLIGNRAGRRLHPSHYQIRPANKISQKFTARPRAGINENAQRCAAKGLGLK
jgi:hypothetical protein